MSQEEGRPTTGAPTADETTASVPPATAATTGPRRYRAARRAPAPGERMNDHLAAALWYAAAGWPVFPCKPGEKVPHGFLVPHGVKDASTAADRITSWWSRSPLANVAIATGDPGPDVVDLDVTAGKPGRASYARLRAAGLLEGARLVIATPSGGRHLYYAGTGQGNGSIPRHGVDFRGRGGYVLAPPSVVGGKPYTVVEAVPQTGVLVDFVAVRRVLDPPRPVRAPSRSAVGDHEALVRHVAGLPEGNRNGGLFWAACRAVEGAAGDDVFRALVAAAVTAGLTEREARRTVESARRSAAA